MANFGRGVSGALTGGSAGLTMAPALGLAGPVGLGIGAALGLVGGLFSGDNQAEEYIQQAMKQFEGIVPPDLAREIVYTQFMQGGTLTPQQLSRLPEEAQQVILLQEPPEVRAKQEAQLQAMEQLAQTGMGPQERLAFETAKLKAAQGAQARMKGLMQQYQQMGQAGGPAAMMAQAQALQQSTQDEYLANLQTAAQAADNRRAAIQAAMAGASQLRQQDLGVQQANVEAMRQRQMFDMQNAMARQQWNAQAAQQANIMNLQRQQAMMDRNIQMQNQELYRRMYLAPQQMYQNQLALAAGRAGVYDKASSFYQKQAEADATNWATLMGGVGDLAGAISKMPPAKKEPTSWSDPWYGPNAQSPVFK